MEGYNEKLISKTNENITPEQEALYTGSKSPKNSFKFKRFFSAFLIVGLILALVLSPKVVSPETVQADTVQVKVTPQFYQSKAREMLPIVNKWRAGSTWYYNKDGQVVKAGGLKALKYDYTLEKYAMQRAGEIALAFEHTRPSGSSKSGVKGYVGMGENIAATTNQKGVEADYGFNMFLEEDKPYSGQGHRRIMLSVSADFDAVGMAVCRYNGTYYWVQIFGCTSDPDEKYIAPTDGNMTITADVDTSRVISKTADFSLIRDITLAQGKTQTIPNVNVTLGMEETWPFNTVETVGIPIVTSSNTGVVSVNGNTLTAVGEGTSNVTIREPLTGSSKAIKVNVSAIHVTGVTLNNSSLSIVTGNSGNLSATVAPANADNKSVTWSSSNTSVATVDNNGKVTGVAPGTATITVRTNDQGKTATCNVTVRPVNVTGVSLDRTSATINHKDTLTLNATVAPSNASNKNVTWSSSDTTVATVNSSGLVTGVNPGSAVITVKTSDQGKTATSNITVRAVPVSGVSVDLSDITLNTGNEYTLKAIVAPGNASNKSVSWKSSDPSIVSVNGNGLIKGLKPGSATITVTTADGNKSSVCSVTVPEKSVAITGVTPVTNSVNVASGDTQNIAVNVSPANATNKTIVWTSSNESVATVDSNGNVTGVGGGSATISGRTVDGGKTFSVTVNVRPSVVTDITLNQESLTLKRNATANLTATAAPADVPDKTVSWSSENAQVASVDASGKVTGLQAGLVNVTATANDGGGASKSASVRVQFDDVTDQNSAFYNSIYWALDNGITTGIGNNLFATDNNCTRGQAVTFLWRTAGKPEPSSTANPFKDLSSGSAFYKAILWAAEQGITTGFDDKTFRQDDSCTRGQIVTFIWRAAGKPNPASSQNRFKDVSSSSAFYNAILWAAGNGITTGFDDGTFRQDNVCTRGQIVTFLFRQYGK